jgi:hypothetical protein
MNNYANSTKGGVHFKLSHDNRERHCGLDPQPPDCFWKLGDCGSNPQ